MPRNTVRIASVPASHVYVRHLSSPTDPDPQVVRLPDPIPKDGRTVPGGWWPPLMLDPRWISRHHTEFDVFHLHFGFDAISPATMGDVIAELRGHRKPLVYTLHDLRNPHHPESGAHEEILDLLVPAADEVITLTPGAAEEISDRWDRKATVLPHPHVIPRHTFASRANTSGEFTVGVHAKSVRANMNPIPVIEALLAAADEYADVMVQINVHDEIHDPDNHWYNPAFAESLHDVAAHPRGQGRGTSLLLG